MGRFGREELEGAFRHYWQTGAVGEDWAGFAALFTPDALYLEHVLGVRRGPEEIRAWLEPTMERYCELYTVYEWHMVDPEAERIVVYMQNRRDHPSGKGAIDFAGLTILHYAGDGRFDFEEDFWAVPAAQKAFKDYAAACKQHDPDHQARRTRLDWGNGPDWTRGAATWFERPGA
jgi:hypothetical protein